MALQRLDTTTFFCKTAPNARYASGETHTVCFWANPAVLQTLLFTYAAGTQYVGIELQPGNKLAWLWQGAAFKLVLPDSGLGVWHWYCGTNINPGGYNIQRDTIVLTGASASPQLGPFASLPAIGLDNGTVGHPVLLSDLRWYDRVLSTEERATIFASQGKDGIVAGLIDRAPYLDYAPGIQVGGAVQPTSITPTVNPFSSGGAGTPFQWAAGPGPLRRRAI